MKQEAIERLEKKGITGARAVVNELLDSGALTHYDLCKYVARERWFEDMERHPDRSPTEILRDTAYQCHISPNTLKRTL